MAGYDGSIRIDTKINSSGFNNGIKNINSGLMAITKSLKNIAIAAGVAFSFKAVLDFGKASVAAATEMQNALMGLQSIMEGQGRSFQKAKGFIDEYISDGLIPATKAITAYKNLALRGYDDSQIQQVLIALKDSAAFGRQSSYSLGEAVETATEGLKNENSILVDNAGVTKNVAKMWDEYAKSIGTTSNNLTQQQKIQAEVNGILEETKYQAGDAAKIADSYSGMVLRLGFAFNNLKIAVGNALMPVLKTLIPPVIELVNWFTMLANKIAQLSALLFGKSISANTKTAESATAAAGATKELADSTQKAGNAAEKAGKQAKGALASFDKLSVLNIDKGNGSSGSGGAAEDGGISAESVLDTTTEIEEADSAVSGLMDRLKELAVLFQTGFTVGKGSSFEERVNDIKTSLISIKDTLKNIFTDPEVMKSANHYLDTLAFNAGLQVGAFVSIGTTIAQNIIGGIELFFTQSTERIRDYLVEIFDIGSRTNIIAGRFSQSFAYIFEAFGSENGKQLTANIIGMFAEAFMGITTLVGEAMADVLDAITKPFIDNKEYLRQTLEDALGYFAEGFGNLEERAKDTFETIKDLYNTNFKPIIETLGALWSEVFTYYVMPLLSKFGELWEAVTSRVKIIWEEVIKPFLEWISPAFSASFAIIGAGIIGLIGIVSDVVGKIIDAFTGIINFLNNVFSGNWKAAWDSIVGLFKGIFNGLIDIAKKPINAIISMLNGLIRGVVKGINAVIDGINTIDFTVPDWVPLLGGKGIKFSLSHLAAKQIPLLATGAVIPPNQQFMAVLGDQKNGRNLEAPESLIRQIMREEMAGLNTEGSITVETPVYLDGEIIFKNQQKVSRRHGTKLVLGGV